MTCCVAGLDRESIMYDADDSEGQVWIDRKFELEAMIGEGYSLSRIARHYDLHISEAAAILDALGLMTLGARKFEAIKRALAGGGK
jgi:hypothetical protein